MRRVGLFGGTFNPPHVGHVRAAVEAREALGLDLVEMIPAASPPHKAGAGMLPAGLRAGLLALCIEGLAGIRVCPIELDRPGPSYTIDTLRQYARDNPGAELSFIMGVNDLFNLPYWKQGRDLGRAAHLAILPREGLGLAETADFLARHEADFGIRREAANMWIFEAGCSLRFVDVPRLDVSASMIREKWRRGLSLAGLIPAPALALLAQRDDLAAYWSRT